MAGQTLILDISARGVATITLNRPERGNAFNQTMLAEFVNQVAGLAADPHVRVIVLAASGRHFCVGADLSERGGETKPPAVDLLDALKLLDECPKLTIAVVQGGCVGAGLALVACCDVALATEQAFFSIPEVRLGLVPTLTPLFVRAIGTRAFRRYGLTGERFSAAQADRLGLAHYVGATDALDVALRGVIDEAMHGAPQALAALKAAVASLVPVPSAQIFPPRLTRQALDIGTPEAIEGIAAFREKRKPSWYRA